MELVLYVIGFLFYIFIAQIFHNLTEHKYMYDDGDKICPMKTMTFLGFPTIIVFMICKIPMKLADFVTNPKNYKFSIKIERK